MLHSFVVSVIIHQIAEMKDGRLPMAITKNLGYWKAEEFVKFAYPASEYVLGGLLPDAEYHIWILICRITELLFNTGRSGFSDQDSELLSHFIARHNILTEEVQGSKSCVVSLHHLMHIVDDIEEFSTVDNYWCFSFERAVSKYVSKSSNKKNLELTYAKSECRREFLKFYSGGGTSIFERIIDNLVCGFAMIFSVITHVQHPLQFHVNNIAEAHRLNEQGLGQGGILIGKKRHDILEAREAILLQETLHLPTVQDHIVRARSIFMPKHQYSGTVYRLGELVLITDPKCDDSVEVIVITSIFSTQGMNSALVMGDLYSKMTNTTGHVHLHEYSGNPYVKPTSIKRIVPCCCIKRKIMLFPEHENLEDPKCFIVIDYQRPSIPISVNDIIIPFFPIAGDMIKVKGTLEEDIWLAHVQNVHIGDHTCKVHFYVQDMSYSGVGVKFKQECTRMEEIHWASILGAATGTWMGKYWMQDSI